MPNFMGKSYSYDAKGMAEYDQAMKDCTGRPTGQ